MAQFKGKLKRNETVVGPWITVPDAAIVEILGRTGFDFLLIDGEHAPFDKGGRRSMPGQEYADGYRLHHRRAHYPLGRPRLLLLHLYSRHRIPRPGSPCRSRCRQGGNAMKCPERAEGGLSRFPLKAFN